MTRLMALAGLLALGACTSAKQAPEVAVETKIITPVIDPSLLDCGAAPAPPAHAALQSDVARYMVTLWAWGSECRSHLLAIGQILAPTPAPKARAKSSA